MYADNVLSAVSFKAQFQTDGTGEWYENDLRFATQREALDYARDLFHRWVLVHSTRVVSADGAANYSFLGGVLERLKSVSTLATTGDRQCTE